MRWEALFADLEAQLEAASASSEEELAGLIRAEVARTELSDRLRAHVGAPVALQLADGRWVRGAVVDAAPQWLLVGPEGAAGGIGPAGRQVLVPLTALDRVVGLSRAVAAPAGVVEQRLGIGSALRALARDRAGVALMLRGGDLDGTIDRVGADHLDLAVHPAGEPRRSGTVSDVVAVPLAALLGVRAGAG